MANVFLMLMLDNGRASKGTHGKKGSMASEKQRNKANSKQKMSKVNSTWTSTNRCSSKSATKDLNDLNRTTEYQEAELRRKNQADKIEAEQQLKDLDSQNRNVESLRRTEDKHTASIQKDLKLKEKQTQAEQNQINSHSNAMLFNSDCIQETDKTLQQNAEKLEILRKLENTRKDILSSFSLQRVHQTQRTGVYNGNHNEEDFHDIETIHEEGGYGADVLSNECLQLLDDIVSQHSKDMQVSKKLASLTQQMVTIISDSELPTSHIYRLKYFASNKHVHNSSSFNINPRFYCHAFCPKY